MKKIGRIVLILLFVGLLVFTFRYLYKKSKPVEEAFTTQNAEIKNIVKKTMATGAVVPRKEIEIKPQVSGIIQNIYVKPGDKIKEGDLIAKIKIIPDMIQLNNAHSRLEKAKISHEDKQLIYNRYKKLFKQGVIPEADYQAYKLGYDNAMEELEAAKDNLQLIKEGVTQKAEKTSNTLIRSTTSGMVLDVPVEEGNSVIEVNTFNDGTTIASIADMSDMIFEGTIDETEIGKINEGMNLDVTIGAIEDKTFEAILQYISPKGKEQNGAVQFDIKADMKREEESFIRAGYSANANIILDKKDSVLTIPEKLLQFKNQNPDSVYVEVLRDPETNRYEQRFLKTGLSDGVIIEVIEGVTKEDKIKVPK